MNNNETGKTCSASSKVFGPITSEIGTPACARKPKVKPPGRRKGAKQIRRIRYPIVFKKPNAPKRKAA